MNPDRGGRMNPASPHLVSSSASDLQWSNRNKHMISNGAINMNSLRSSETERIG